MPDKGKRYRSCGNYYISETCGEGLLTPLSGSPREMGSMLTMTETGTEIVRMMEAGLTVGEMAEQLMERYDCPSRETVESDVERFAAGLVARGYFTEERG